MSRELSIPPDELARQKMLIRMSRDVPDETDSNVTAKQQGEPNNTPASHEPTGQPNSIASSEDLRRGVGTRPSS